MLQYRIVRKACFHRHFDEDNNTVGNDWTYMIESAFHEVCPGLIFGYYDLIDQG